MSRFNNVEEVLEKHIPRDELAEVKRVLYGKPTESLALPKEATDLAAKHKFEIKACNVPCKEEQVCC